MNFPHRLPIYEDFMDIMTGGMLQVHGGNIVWGWKHEKGRKIQDIQSLPDTSKPGDEIAAGVYRVTDANDTMIMIESPDGAYLITYGTYQEIKSRT